MALEPIVFETEGVTYATVDLTCAGYDGYYSGLLQRGALAPIPLPA